MFEIRKNIDLRTIFIRSDQHLSEIEIRLYPISVLIKMINVAPEIRGRVYVVPGEKRLFWTIEYSKGQ